MKKKELRENLESAEEMLRQIAAELADALNRAYHLAAENTRLKARVEDMEKHWRPVPLKHPWEPRNAQCKLCDDPRDAERHS